MKQTSRMTSGRSFLREFHHRNTTFFRFMLPHPNNVIKPSGDATEHPCLFSPRKRYQSVSLLAQTSHQLAVKEERDFDDIRLVNSNCHRRRSSIQTICGVQSPLNASVRRVELKSVCFSFPPRTSLSHSTGRRSCSTASSSESSSPRMSPAFDSRALGPYITSITRRLETPSRLWFVVQHMAGLQHLSLPAPSEDLRGLKFSQLQNLTSLDTKLEELDPPLHHVLDPAPSSLSSFILTEPMPSRSSARRSRFLTQPLCTLTWRRITATGRTIVFCRRPSCSS